MNPYARASSVLVFVKIHPEFDVVAQRRWPRIKIDPGLFRFTLQIDFDRFFVFTILIKNAETGKKDRRNL